MPEDKDFQWNDELVKECSIFLMNAFNNPNSNNSGKWEGINIELNKWKEKKSKEKDIPKCEYEVFVLEGNRDTAIKRLSDGEIFKAGEVDEKYGTILMFQYLDLKKEHYAMCNKEGHITHVSIPCLSKGKPKVPLFTTADGKDCYEEDKFLVYFVSKDWQVSTTTPHYAIRTTGYSKIFFDNEKTNEYILLNKPIDLSYTEMIALLDKTYNPLSPMSNLRLAIKEVFKSKINP